MDLLVNAVVCFPSVLLTLHQIEICAHIHEVVLQCQNSFGLPILLKSDNPFQRQPVLSIFLLLAFKPSNLFLQMQAFLIDVALLEM